MPVPPPPPTKARSALWLVRKGCDQRKTASRGGLCWEIPERRAWLTLDGRPPGNLPTIGEISGKKAGQAFFCNVQRKLPGRVCAIEFLSLDAYENPEKDQSGASLVVVVVVVLKAGL